MNNNKILDTLELEEAVNSFVFPIRLSEEQKKLAAAQLKDSREISQLQATSKTKLTARLMQLKFQIEEYFNYEEFDNNKRFGDFLKLYLNILDKQRNEFAREIGVHETMVSQLINNHRLPGDNIIIRLELHSNKSIPADYWLRLVEKDKINDIKTNKQLRSKEKNHVSYKIPIRI